MYLQIESSRAGDVAILECKGRLVRGNPVLALRDAVTRLHDVRIIVLDLTALENLDAGGLGMLVLLHRWARGNDVQIKLVNANTFVREMLDRTRLTCVFDVSSVEDAVEILCSAEEPRMSLEVSRAVA
jgi:HptB-dependent secretion and biofilm anti anti-sigma factor